MSATLLTNRPLAASESFTQAIRDRFNDREPIGAVRALVYADKAGTLYLEESDDEGAHYAAAATVSVSAATTTELAWTALTKRWYRFRYANSTTAQTNFRLIQQTRGLDVHKVDIGDKDFATQTTLAAVLAKIIAAPATEAKQDSIITLLQGLSRQTVTECQDQDDADANVLTFAANISAIEIYHNEVTAQEFEVNGLTLAIAPGGWRSPIGGTPAATVTIPAGVDCIVSRLV